MLFIDTLMSMIRRLMPWSGIEAAKQHLTETGIATPSQAHEAAVRVRQDLNDRRRR